MAFSVKEINLGEVKGKTNVDWEFFVVGKDVEIKSLKSSCGCTVPKQEGNKIFGSIKIPAFPITNKNKSVKQQKTITVVTRENNKLETYKIPIIFTLINEKYDIVASKLNQAMIDIRPYITVDKNLKIAYDALYRYNMRKK